MTNDHRVRISFLFRVWPIKIICECCIYSGPICSDRLKENIFSTSEYFHCQQSEFALSPHCQYSNIRWVPVAQDCLHWVQHLREWIMLAAKMCWLFDQSLVPATISMWSFRWWAIPIAVAFYRSIRIGVDPVRLKFVPDHWDCIDRGEWVLCDAVWHVDSVQVFDGYKSKTKISKYYFRLSCEWMTRKTKSNVWMWDSALPVPIEIPTSRCCTTILQRFAENGRFVGMETETKHTTVQCIL